MKQDVYGFTLIETLVTLTLMSILIWIGIGSVHDLILSYRVKSATSLLMHTLATARAEAVMRGRRVFVCRRASASSTECGSNRMIREWQHGWLVKLESNGEILQQGGEDFFHLGILIRANLGNAKIIYNAMGNSLTFGNIEVLNHRNNKNILRKICIARNRLGLCK